MATRYPYMLAALGLAWLAAPPLQAQQDPAAVLDQLSDAATMVGPGTALARQQMQGGDLTGAVATLERVLANHPEAYDVLLLHASLLCRLDDGDGARVEIDEVGNRPTSRQAWAEVNAACGAAARPRGY